MITVQKEKALTAEHLRGILHYEKKTGIMTWVFPPKNHPRMLGKNAGSTRTGKGKSYIWIKVDRVAYSLSRLAFLWVTGEWPKEQIDHKNGNSLDNRWKNLRAATQVQNSWNHKKRARRINLPMGVKQLASGRFQARIAKNKVMHTIGSFDSPLQAKRAYEKKRKEFYGEFA